MSGGEIDGRHTWPRRSHPPHRLTQEVGGATGGVGPALAQRDISTSPVPAAIGQQRVIAAGAGIAVVARSLLGQSIGLADVESRSMVRGESPGPAPAAQARANNWRLTRSS